MRLFVPLLACLFSVFAGEPKDCSLALNRAEYTSAVTCAHQYLENHPESVVALVILAQAYMGANDSSAAMLALRRALQIDPDDIDALYYLGKLSNVLAQAELHQLYVMAPGSMRVHQLMAQTYHEQGDEENEEKEYLTALSLKPSSPAVLNALGVLCLRRSRYEEAFSYYSRAIVHKPADYDALYGLGAVQLHRQDLTAAVHSFRRALQVQPGSAAAHFALGDALLRSGKNAEAADELRLATDLEPGMKEAYALLGRAYQRLGNIREASKTFAKFQSLSRFEVTSGILKPETTPR